jgi:hypothetical protein
VIEPGVLLEVGDLAARRPGDVATLRDPLAHLWGALIDIDLVAEHQQLVRPVRDRGALHAQGQRVESIVLAPALVLVGTRGVRGLVGEADAAGAEDDAQRLAGSDGPDDAGREFTVGPRPAGLALQADGVLGGAAGAQPIDDHQAVMVGLHVKGLRPVTKHLDLAWGVGLHPDGGLGFADVAQEGSEDEGRHRA